MASKRNDFIKNLMAKKVLIIGSGSMGLKHAKTINANNPLYKIFILARKNKISMPEYIEDVLKSLDEALQINPDYVVIANPAKFHLSDLEKLVSAGHKKILIEKPICTSFDDIDHSPIFLNKKNLSLQVGYNLRFYESLVFLRNKIQSQFLGLPIKVEAKVGQHLSLWREGIDYRHSVTAQKKLGGGALLELSHEIDYLRWIFGEFLWVSGKLDKVSDLDIDVEDSVFIKAESKFSKNKKVSISLSMDLICNPPKRYCLVTCENGLMKWNGLTNDVKIYNPNNNKWKTLFHGKKELNSTYKDQWRSFVNKSNNPKSIEIKISEGIKVIEIIEAVRASSLNNSEKITVKRYGK